MGIDVSPGGEFLLSGSADGRAVVYDVQRGRRLQQLVVGGGGGSGGGGACVCCDVAWHPVVPGTVAVATRDGGLSIWE